MAIKHGNNDINKLYLGNDEVSKIYLGTNEVYSSGLSDLTGTTWSVTSRYHNDTMLTIEKFYKLNITINNKNYASINHYRTPDSYILVGSSSFSSGYGIINERNNIEGFFLHGEEDYYLDIACPFTIQVLGGNDSTDIDLINWFTTNFTRVS